MKTVYLFRCSVGVELRERMIEHDVGKIGWRQVIEDLKSQRRAEKLLVRNHFVAGE